ncbi:MAG: PAS domain-containing protein [Hyphomicrobium sp.]|nr:PAS domain-containing protein [Hyphomicrobium sp.]
MSLHVPPKHFLEALPIAIYACAADGRILWFNERACRLWGRTPRVGDAHELYCGAYTVFAGERRIPPEETPMAEVLRTGTPIRSAEARVQRPDASEVWAEIHIEPVRDEAGAVIGAINCFHETNGPPREHMRWLAEAYDNARIGIAEVERGGQLRRLNAHLRDILQAAPEDKAPLGKRQLPGR